MKKIFNFIIERPVICILVIIVIFFIPPAFTTQPEGFSKLIVKCVGIDKIGDEYELTLIAYVPTPSQDFGENFQSFSGKGSNINEAIIEISKLTGKSVALGEANIILVNNEASDYGLLTILDFLVREYSLGNNNLIVNTGEVAANEVLDTCIKIAREIGINVHDIAEFNRTNVFAGEMCLEGLFSQSLSPSKCLLLSKITLEEERGLELEEDKSQGSGGGSGEGGESEGGGQSSGGESEKPKKLVNLGDAVILKEGKRVLDLTPEETTALLWGNSREDFGIVKISNYNDDKFTDADITLFVFRNEPEIKTKFFGEKAVCEFNIKTKLTIYEVNQELINYKFYKETYRFKTDNISEASCQKIGTDFSSMLRVMIENDIDIFDIYENFDANHTRKFRKLLSNLENPDEYLKSIEFVINVDVEIME